MKWALGMTFALAVALSTGGVAEGCVPTTSNPELTVDASPIGGPTYYYDEDCLVLDPCPYDIWGIWVYEESNGIPGLQRSDQWKDDTCAGSIPADTIIF